VRSRRVARITLAFAFGQLSLTGNAAFKSRANFLAGRLLERIGAAPDERSEKESEEKRPGLHPLILGNNDLIANSQRTISNAVA